MQWFTRDDKLPPKNTKILVFSPIYPEGDSLRFRVLDSEFFCIATDATHWTELVAPEHQTLEAETFELEHDDFFP
jgi:hypothetical protein